MFTSYKCSFWVSSCRECPDCLQTGMGFTSATHPEVMAKWIRGMHQSLHLYSPPEPWPDQTLDAGWPCQPGPEREGVDAGWGVPSGSAPRLGSSPDLPGNSA